MESIGQNNSRQVNGQIPTPGIGATPGVSVGQAGANLPIKKTEKIVTAVYMVSGHIADLPLQRKIRECALSLVCLVRALNAETSRQFFKEAILLAEDLSACLNLAATMGFVSAMNGEVITKVLRELHAALCDSRESCVVFIDVAPVLEITDSEIAPPLASNSKQALSLPKLKSAHRPASRSIGASGTASSPGQPIGNGSKTVPLASKDGPAVKITQKKKIEAKKSMVSAKVALKKVEVKKPNEFTLEIKDKDKGQNIVSSIGQPVNQKERRDTIMSIVRDLQRFSIKDVVQRMPEIGEKTIQRELGVLIEAGILKKEGEKRWVQYYL